MGIRSLEEIRKSVLNGRIDIDIRIKSVGLYDLDVGLGEPSGPMLVECISGPRGRIEAILVLCTRGCSYENVFVHPFFQNKPASNIHSTQKPGLGWHGMTGIERQSGIVRLGVSRSADDGRINEMLELSPFLESSGPNRA